LQQELLVKVTLVVMQGMAAGLVVVVHLLLEIQTVVPLEVQVVLELQIQ
jgi:hypothetical protein